MLDSRPLLVDSNLIAKEFPAIARVKLDTLQVNLGYLCNLSCTHCHVNAGPRRKELMDKEQVDLVIKALDQLQIKTLDLTGGAPEMNPHFEYLLRAAHQRGVEVIDRCNLTILLEPGYESLADLLAQTHTKVVASLPCYSEQNVDLQRGKGVYESSIEALKLLNKLGYGKGDPERQLHLVYNPDGPHLPPPQETLQAEYKTELFKEHGIVFDELFTITNMPIERFGSRLQSHDQFSDYMQLLIDAYQVENMTNLMCRNMVSIDYQGFIYDCDFNQMLEIQLGAGGNQQRQHLTDLLDGLALDGAPIATASHCFACTAGQGSSCGGALND